MRCEDHVFVLAPRLVYVRLASRADFDRIALPVRPPIDGAPEAKVHECLGPQGGLLVVFECSQQ